MTLIAKSSCRPGVAVVKRSLQQKRRLAAVAVKSDLENGEAGFGSFPTSPASSSQLAPKPTSIRKLQPRFPPIVFPAPVLTEFPRQSSNSLKIVSSIPLATVAHTLAIVRAVEKECENTVVDVRQWKRRDNPGGNSIVYLTLLYPVEFPTNNPSREIRVDLPRLASIEKADPRIRNGGPTLQEVEAALSPSPSSAPLGNRPPAQFSIHVELNPPERYPIKYPKESERPDRSARDSARSRRDKRLTPEAQQALWREEAQQQTRDEEAIIEVLGKWRGRYGGFESLQKTYEGYVSPSTARKDAEDKAERVRLEGERAREERTRGRDIERERVAQEERARKRSLARHEARLAASRLTTTSEGSSKDSLISPLGTGANVPPSPQHAPKPIPILPSEKRILQKFGPIASASAPGGLPYSLKSQEGKVDALRQEAWDAKARRRDELSEKKGKGVTGFVTNLLQNGFGGEKK